MTVTDTPTTEQALAAVQEILDDYVIFPSDEARDAVVLWTAHTYVFYSFETTPRLSVSSKEPGSGKSRVLEIIEHLVPSPLNAVTITPGVMWRLIEHSSPTILIDEADTIFGQNGSGSSHMTLRSILNAGHSRTATVPRCVGAEDVKRFHVFAPVAMAGLGQLPETIATRSVQVVMRKRRAGQEVKPFRARYAQDALKRAKAILEEWSIDAAETLQTAIPDCPVKDRDADVWEPLLAIAELAGDVWAKRARTACEELTSSVETLTPGMQLLTDLRTVWDGPVMFTADILPALYALPESKWTRTDARSFAAMLRNYDVSPTTVRQGERVAKGYKVEDLQAAWEKFDVTAVTL